jgi:phage shock protein A
MLKKILIGSAIVGGSSVALLGTSALSYVRTGVHSIRQEVKNQIPVEVEITRCRDMIRQIDPEIAHNLQTIAREEVEIERLQREVSTKKEKLATAKGQIMRLRADLTENKPHYVYASRKYSPDQVREDLTNRFEHFKSQETNVEQLDRMLIAREQKLQAARNNLDQMLAAKRQLEVELENLEARHTMVQVATTSSKLNLDVSQLSQTRELLEEIATRIDVAEKLAASEGIPMGAIPVDEPVSSDVLEEIANYFDRNQPSNTRMVDSEAVEDSELADL